MQGKKLLRDWMEAPIADLDELSRRQDAVQAMVRDGSSRALFRTLLAQVLFLPGIGMDKCNCASGPSNTELDMISLGHGAGWRAITVD